MTDMQLTPEAFNTELRRWVKSVTGKSIGEVGGVARSTACRQTQGEKLLSLDELLRIVELCALIARLHNRALSNAVPITLFRMGQMGDIRFLADLEQYTAEHPEHRRLALAAAATMRARHADRS